MKKEVKFTLDLYFSNFNLDLYTEICTDIKAEFPNCVVVSVDFPRNIPETNYDFHISEIDGDSHKLAIEIENIIYSEILGWAFGDFH